MVCNIYSECGSFRHLLSDAVQKSQLAAMRMLQRTMNHLEKVDRKSFEFETLHTITKVTDVLRYTLHRPHDPWVMASFKFLKMAIQKVKLLLFRKLMPRSESLVSDDDLTKSEVTSPHQMTCTQDSESSTHFLSSSSSSLDDEFPITVTLGYSIPPPALIVPSTAVT